MSQGKRAAWFEDDPKPNTFFFRSAFHSWQFILNSVLVVGVCLAYGAVLWNYWNSLNRYFAATFVFLLLNVVYPYWWALKRHAKIRELFRSGEIAEQAAGSPFDSLLQVADASMNEGLRNSSAMFGIFFLAVVFWRFHNLK